jgi:hypothetical protein
LSNIAVAAQPAAVHDMRKMPDLCTFTYFTGFINITGFMHKIVIHIDNSFVKVSLFTDDCVNTGIFRISINI